MLSSERIAKLDAMSAEDMAAEVAKGRFSRFNEESRRYMEGRLATMNVREEQDTKVIQSDSQAKSDFLAAEGVRWGKWGAAIGLFGVVVAVILAKCS